ncbi:MAG: hypothetical protein JW850_14410 [Thermoflexales bacterium]|nr:hypothetical protein [Thermoflexales bacterium]
MAYNTADIRRFLIQSLSDDEFTALCFDDFRDVHEQLSAGMTRGQKVQLLLDYCERRGKMTELLAVIRDREAPEEKAATGRPAAQESGSRSVKVRVDGENNTVTTAAGDVNISNVYNHFTGGEPQPVARSPLAQEASLAEKPAPTGLVGPPDPSKVKMLRQKLGRLTALQHSLRDLGVELDRGTLETGRYTRLAATLRQERSEILFEFASAIQASAEAELAALIENALASEEDSFPSQLLLQLNAWIDQGSA